jgi:site-specific recombinase XerD
MAWIRISRPRSEPGDEYRRRKRVRPRDLRDLARFLWEKGLTLTNATEKDAAAWVRTLKRRSASGETPMDSLAIFRKIAVARGFFDRLRRSQSPNPFGRYKTRRSDRPVAATLPISPQELRRLVETMNPESPWGRRNRAIALLRFTTDLSIAEICRLERKQVVLGKKTSVVCLWRKGRATKKIRLRGPVQTALRKHLRSNPTRGPQLFQAMPESLSSSQARVGRGRGRPLSARWISSMLRRAGLEVGLSIPRA